MADLVRARTEIECLIADFSQASEGGERRRGEVARELEGLEGRIEEADKRLEALIGEVDERTAEEREAKQEWVTRRLRPPW